MQLPLKKTFTIDQVSTVDGVQYTGAFTVKKMTMGDRLRMGAIKAQYLAGYSIAGNTSLPVDDVYAVQAEAMAQCDVALTERPAWFIPEKMLDLELFYKIFKEVADFELAFFSARTNAGSKEETKEEPKQATT